MIIQAALLATALSVQETPVETEYSICDDLGSLATAVMTARQQGVSMSEVMAVATRSTAPELEPLNEVAREMVMEAYGEPRWHTPQSQLRAVEDFRDAYLLACYSAD